MEISKFIWHILMIFINFPIKTYYIKILRVTVPNENKC